MIDVAELRMTTGLTRAEAVALRTLVRNVDFTNPLIADVGSWKGFSCAILASEVKHRGGKVVAVDHRKGNSGTWNVPVAGAEDIHSDFIHNMDVLGYTDMVYVLSMTSDQALDVLQDDSFSLIFIDADHRYAAVRNDIEGWWKKLKVGGILCGHDCEAYYYNLPEQTKRLMGEHLEEDYLDEISCHPGVVLAVYDCFGESFSIMNDTRIWYKKKEETNG